ncbi:MAG TPA: hypothetical protein VII74_02735, partial [Chthoniobacterales bacterium]
ASTTVAGGLNSKPSTAFTLQFFNNLGSALLGTKTVTTGRGGDAFFQFTFPFATPASDYVTATATDPAGNTSEFSPPNGTARFANLSSRGNVGAGEKVLIAGFNLDGGPAKKLLIRALGPSLGQNGTLADPKLDVYGTQNAYFSHASNDNWRDSQETEIEATGLAPSNDREAALIFVTSTVPFSPPSSLLWSAARTAERASRLWRFTIWARPTKRSPPI